MSTAHFQVIFNGPAVEGGEIDVRELSASLTALNQLFEESDTLINGGRTSHVLKVRGSFKTGSFKVFFSSQQGAIEAAKRLLLGDDATAVANAAAILELLLLGGAGAASLLAVLKWLKGRKVTKIIETDDKKFAVYVGKHHIKTEERVIKLYESFKVREAFEAAIAAPLKEGKINSIAFTDDKGKSFVEATAEEKTYFEKIPEQSSPLPPRKFEMDVSITRLSFESDKWAVFDGQHTLHVTMGDAGFTRRVDESQESFAKGDILRVRMRIDQSETSSGLKIEHTIEKVIEHRRPAFRGQLSLDVGEEQRAPARAGPPAKSKAKRPARKK